MFKKYRHDRCYIIAEIGGNFNTFDEAQILIDEAKNCDVDAVKLQTYRADTISSKKALFDMENTGVVSQHSLFQKYEVSDKLHKQVFEYAQSQGLDWFSTPSHQKDVDLLEKCGVEAHKIGSDDATNLPFLRYVAKTGKPIILSTGMCTLNEVSEAINEIFSEGNENIILLHAITSYPTHAENVNLKAIRTLMDRFPGIDVGYSDHTLSPVASLCAVAMGARVIEKHFTYNKEADGPDHMLSADPKEMKWLVESIRTFELMKGSGIKRPADSEKTTRINNRKSIIIDKDIKAGQTLKAEHLAIKRPGYGIAPKNLEQLIGQKVSKNLEKDTVLTWEYLGDY